MAFGRINMFRYSGSCPPYATQFRDSKPAAINKLMRGEMSIVSVIESPVVPDSYFDHHDLRITALEQRIRLRKA
jgi:hypothetical protein